MFRDSTGREFAAVLVLPTVTALRKIGVSLADDLPALLQGLQDDPERLVNALYIVHRDSSEAHGLNDEQFGRILDGDTLAGAVESLVDAIVNFSPPATRPALRKLVQKSREVEQVAGAKAVEAIDRLTPEAILQSWSNSVGNVPESPDSIQHDARSGNSTGPREPDAVTSGTASGSS